MKNDALAEAPTCSNTPDFKPPQADVKNDTKCQTDKTKLKFNFKGAIKKISELPEVSI